MGVFVLGGQCFQHEENYFVDLLQSETNKKVPLYGQWNVTQNSYTCIMIKAQIEFSIKYTVGGSPKGPVTVPMTENAIVVPSQSHCFPLPSNATLTTQTITWRFLKDWLFTMQFSNSSSKSGKPSGDYYVISGVRLIADLAGHPELFNNTQTKSLNVSVMNGTFGDIGMKEHSVMCKEGYSKQLSPSVKLTIKRFQYQAFQNSTTFLKEYICEADLPKVDLIPIIVGACLAGLVLCVTIVYIVKTARQNPSVLPSENQEMKRNEDVTLAINGDTEAPRREHKSSKDKDKF
jgi:hypothetical protein